MREGNKRNLVAAVALSTIALVGFGIGRAVTNHDARAETPVQPVDTLAALGTPPTADSRGVPVS
mgnify:CR=1 FL=1